MKAQTRTIRALTARDALRQVRVEMGEDAVILSNRRVGDHVEIVAAAHAALAQLEQGGKNEEKENVAQLVEEIRRLQSDLQGQLVSLATPNVHAIKKGKIQRSMVRMGFGSALTEQILEQMPEHMGLGWVTQVLERNLRALRGDEVIVGGGGVFALVGPTGVGKTTTTAKLAARAVVRYGAARVGLVTTDSYRVGAHEQLRIYGRILGVPVHTVKDAADLKTTLNGLRDKHLVLVDTMGMGQRDGRVQEQNDQLDTLGVRRLLLLNATCNLHTLEDVVRVYRTPNVLGCIPTKLDEALAMGGILDVAIRHRLPLCYVANGQRVPEDLREANLGGLLQATFNSLEMVGYNITSPLEFSLGNGGMSYA
ncbi:flagellar biosynthesis protein FlhF [Ferrovum sp.]|uniref:flagellar biosynthesis protein FlhF n=1 Tax=Ferrovum sp. TaxID=2609467 RepID=UPI002602DA4E|nr:flagellar biosynthesis protein FlhF [Ferrovum sp.]